MKKLESLEAVKVVRVFLRELIRANFRNEFAFSAFAKAIFNAFKQFSQTLNSTVQV